MSLRKIAKSIFECLSELIAAIATAMAPKCISCGEPIAAGITVDPNGYVQTPTMVTCSHCNTLQQIP